MQKTWTMAKVWNESLGTKPERPATPRNHIWASELGRSNIDIYLKLKGEEPSNKPNARSKRKFEAGDIWEWIIQIILVKAGIYQTSQEHIKSSLPDLIEVTGRLDHIAGGHPDYENAMKNISELGMPEGIQRGAEAMIEHFREQHPEGLAEKIIEVKSLSSFAMDKVERTGKAINGHDLQCFHYVFNKQMQGAIVYICRDDARMYEIPILTNDKVLFDKYIKRITEITEIVNKGVEPEKEKLIVYDPLDYRFSKNFNVEYSSFLTRLYGFEQPADYDEHVTSLIGRWNRVLARVKAGKAMTKNNDEALIEIYEHGFDADKIIASIPVTGIEEPEY